MLVCDSIPAMTIHIRQNTILIVVISILILLSACSPSEKSITVDQAIVDYDLLYTIPEEIISYDEKREWNEGNGVKPILQC